MPWRQQSRTAQARGAQMLCLSAEDQRLYNRTSLTSRAHRGSLFKRRELVLSSLPNPPPFFFADSRPPVSKVACLISLYLLSTCMYHTFSHITFLDYNLMNSRASVLLDSLLSEHIIRYHMCPWGRLLPGYRTRFFLQRGCCCQGKEVVPVDYIRGKGLSSCLTSGSKIRLTAGFEPCPQGPAPSSFSCSTLSLLMCTLFCAFNTCVSCITFFLGLAASHSSKDPPSLAYWLFASPQLNSVRWCCRGRAKRENLSFLGSSRNAKFHERSPRGMFGQNFTSLHGAEVV